MRKRDLILSGRVVFLVGVLGTSYVLADDEAKRIESDIPSGVTHSSASKPDPSQLTPEELRKRLKDPKFREEYGRWALNELQTSLANSAADLPWNQRFRTALLDQKLSPIQKTDLFYKIQHEFFRRNLVDFLSSASTYQEVEYVADLFVSLRAYIYAPLQETAYSASRRAFLTDVLTQLLKRGKEANWPKEQKALTLNVLQLNFHSLSGHFSPDSPKTKKASATQMAKAWLQACVEANLGASQQAVLNQISWSLHSDPPPGLSTFEIRRRTIYPRRGAEIALAFLQGDPIDPNLFPKNPAPPAAPAPIEIKPDRPPSRLARCLAVLWKEVAETPGYIIRNFNFRDHKRPPSSP